MFLTIFVLLPILIAVIILAALKIKNKGLKIVGIAVPSIIAAFLVFDVLSDIFFFIDLYSSDETDPSSQFVAQVEGVTDNEDGTFTYDDGEVSLTFEEVPPVEMENEIAEAPSVLKGESCGNEWKVVSDDEGTPKTVYVTAGDTTVSAKVNKTPKDSGKEYAASIAAALVTDKKPYSENKDENKYRTDSSSFYIEEANCLLYYPAQLSSFSQKGDSYIFSDKKSSTSLKVTLSPNNYTSMAEVEGFIKNTENNLVLAYGPNWLTSEIRSKEKVFYGYSGFGSKYIVEAELTYPENASKIYDDLREHIKCCFVGDGIWKSKASSEGYSKDRSTAYSDKFSREIAAYYSKEYGVILLYPELFSQVEKEDGMVIFKDPVTGAQITFLADYDCLSLADWPAAYGFDESYIDGERRVKASYLDGGSYAVMYLTDNANVCAILNYPTEYAWVYEEFEQEFTIVTSSSEIRNVEMQTVFIEEYGALITMPLQFTETSFYDGVIRFEDALNGMEMAVSFDYLTSETERKNLFACFDVVADDDHIFIGDSYVRWLSNQGFFYGARGNDMKVLMQIDSPNVERAYESTLYMFSVEFVTEEHKEETKAQTLAKEAVSIENKSDPPEATVQPNKRLVYESDEDYAYAITEGEAWYKIAEDYDKFKIETTGDKPERFVAFDEWKDTLVNILKILEYNNYDVDYYCEKYLRKTTYFEEYDDVHKEIMLQKLLFDVDFEMYYKHYGTAKHDSDLGEDTVSVLETICEVLGIEKPDYVRDKGDMTEETTETSVTQKTEQVQTTAPADDYDYEDEDDDWKANISKIVGIWYNNPALNEDWGEHTSENFDKYDSDIILSDIYIEIDNDGNWSLFQRKSNDVKATKLDYGIFSETHDVRLICNADSTKKKGRCFDIRYDDTDGILYWDYLGFSRDKTEHNDDENSNGDAESSNRVDESSTFDPELNQKDISEFEGTWYDASANTFVEIDGDGNWTSYERKSGNSKAVKKDYGTFTYSPNEEKTYYANSTKNNGVQYTMVEFEPDVFLWNGDAFYENDPANMENGDNVWNDDLHQKYISWLEGTWDYCSEMRGWDDYLSYTYIVIDGDANWSLYKRDSDSSKSTEVDHGIICYSEDPYFPYYAYSVVNDERYQIFDFADDLLFWDDEPYCEPGAYKEEN